MKRIEKWGIAVAILILLVNAFTLFIVLEERGVTGASVAEPPTTESAVILSGDLGADSGLERCCDVDDNSACYVVNANACSACDSSCE